MDRENKRMCHLINRIFTKIVSGASEMLRIAESNREYPLDVLDMLYAYTKDEHYLNIRNQIVKKEQRGEVIRMGDFFDQVERNKTIEIAKKMYQRDKDVTHAIYVIECGLDISAEEAREIFDTEVLGVVLA